MTEEVENGPKWLKELEAKREQRLKAKLGHETGAGAPCLTCEQKCPGLDLHFWRKICKNCKCTKENHDVPDDEIYGWAQFQLLGSKPNASRKFKIAGKKDEVILEWTPKGHKDTVDKYLKTLPVELLPVKGSAAAQERKQLLQKQIPVHDIDPTLCHDLTEAELKLMNDYVAHLKENSVGIGHVIQLGLNRGNLHTFGAPTTQILADRCPTQVSKVETVQLRGANSAHLLKGKNLPDKFRNLSMEERKPLNIPEQLRNSENATPVRDLRYDCYENRDNCPMPLNLSNKGSKFNDIRNPEIPGDTKGIQYSPGRNLLPENFLNKLPLEQNVYPSNEDFSNKLNDIFADANTNYVDTEKIGEFPPKNHKCLPHYAPSQFNRFAENRNPEKFGNIRDFVADTNTNYPEEQRQEFAPNTGNFPNYIPTNFRPVSESKNPEKTGNICDFSAETNTNYDDREQARDFTAKDANNLPHYAPSKFNRLAENRNPEKFGNIRDFVADTNTNYAEEQGREFAPNTGNFPNYIPTNFRPVSESKNPEKTGNIRDFSAETNTNYDDREQARDFTARDANNLPHYAPSKFNRLAENRNPEKFGNIHDFVADTNTNYAEEQGREFAPNTGNFPTYIPNNFRRISESKNPEKTGNIRDFLAETNTNYDDRDQAYDFTARDADNLPHYAPSKFNRFAENRNPQKFGNIRDLAFSTYDPSQVNDQVLENNFAPPNDNLPHNNPQNTLPHQSLSNVVSQHTPYSKIYPNNLSTNIPNQQIYISESDETQLLHSENYLNNQPANIPKTKFLNNLPPNYSPSGLKVPENIQNPSVVNVGAIKDIVYPTAEIKSAVQCDNDDFQQHTPIQKVPNENLSLTCHRCRKNFENDAIVVGIDRSDALFHSRCFTCGGCNQPLADMMYFYYKETNDIYCGRDFAKIRGIPRCKACDELIFVPEYCLAENSTFHVKHFCCFECDTPLAGQDYVVEDSQPICLPCFEKVKADKCNTCFNLIKPDEAGANLNGVHFHATDTCFVCKICKKPLLGSKLLFRNERLYCSGVCYGVDK